MLTLTTYEQEFVKLIEKVKAMKGGRELLKLSGISDNQLDLAQFTNNFFAQKKTVADLSVDPNSNVSQRSAITYINEAPKPQFRLNNYYQLWARLRDTKGLDAANEAILADLLGDVYISDFHVWNLPYCYAFSAMDILEQGMPFIDKPVSKGAKHLDSFIQHVIQSIMYYSNSIAGAVALPDFFASLWFVYQKDKKEGYPTSDPVMFERWVKQQLQLLTYTINQPYRSGTQSPFVNLSVFDKYFLEDLFGELVWIDPETDEVVQADMAGIDYLQKLYSEWFVEENKKQLFTFPVMTSNFVADEVDGARRVLDQNFFKWTAEVTQERALFNIYAGKSGQLSSCCRLRNDATKFYFNSFGSGGVKIGSHRVCTINLPRLAHIADGNWDKFMELLKEKVTIAHNILKAHRDTIQDEINAGVLPLYTLGLMDLNTQFSTVGIIGMYEALYELGYDLCNTDSLAKAEEMSNKLNDWNDERSFAEKVMYNMEQIPGESVSVKLATKDAIVHGWDKYTLYSNQFVPLTKTVPMAHRFRIQGALDDKMSGGAILHVNLADKVQSVDMLMTLMDYAVQSGCVYFAPNYNIQKCENGHISVGKTATCPECAGKIAENYTRVVGYYTPVSTWNEERRGECDYESRDWM